MRQVFHWTDFLGIDLTATAWFLCAIR